jgi:hypothetical protein
MALIASIAHAFGPAQAADSAQERFACTKLPRNIWLPLSTIVERINEQGIDIASAKATIDDCYEVRMRLRDGTIRTVILHPVSGKPLD